MPAGKVRYLTISRVALELVCSLSDKQNGEFNRILFSNFQKLEAGEELESAKTDDKILDIAIREALTELRSGYATYMQRVSARKKAVDDQSAEDQRKTDAESVIDRQLIGDPSLTDRRTIKEKKRKEIDKEQTGRGGDGGEERNLLLNWAKIILSAADFRELENFVNGGGDTEQARIAIHRWRENQKQGSFIDFIEKGDE